MKQGDEIKAERQVGKMGNPYLDQGTFVRAVNQSSVMVMIRGQLVTLPRTKVLRYTPASENAEAEFGQGFEQMVKTVLAACEKMLPNQVWSDFRRDDESRILYLCGEFISVQVGLVDVRSIGGLIQKPAWTVSAWHATSGSRDEPPDVTECDCGHAFGDLQAARLVLLTLFQYNIDAYLESINEDRAAKEWEHEFAG